jgi:hypothetical protein
VSRSRKNIIPQDYYARITGLIEIIVGIYIAFIEVIENIIAEMVM